MSISTKSDAAGKIDNVELLGTRGRPLEFTQTDTGLKVKIPAQMIAWLQQGQTP